MLIMSERIQRLKEETQRLKLELGEGKEFDRHLKEQLEKNIHLKETEKYKEVEKLKQRLKDFLRYVDKKIEEGEKELDSS